jgi:hypothetical protein
MYRQKSSAIGRPDFDINISDIISVLLYQAIISSDSSYRSSLGRFRMATDSSIACRYSDLP